MKNWMRLGGALALAMAVTACAGDDAPDTAAANRDASTPPVGTSGAAGADAEFVRDQLEMGEEEIALGQLAQERGTHPEVKRFGEMMVREHRAAGEELKQVAGANTAAATRQDDDLQETLDDLRKLSGRDFDRKYIEEMIDDHEEGVREVERRAENASNPELRQWAAKTLPKMQQHLELARTIKETLDGEKK